MRMRSLQNEGYFAPFSRWQEFLRSLCAEQRQATLPRSPRMDNYGSGSTHRPASPPAD